LQEDFIRKFYYFLNNFNYSSLLQLVHTGKWKFIDVNEIVLSNIFLGVTACVLALVFLKPTRMFGEKLLVMTPIITVYAVCGVALKNTEFLVKRATEQGTISLGGSAAGQGMTLNMANQEAVEPFMLALALVAGLGLMLVYNRFLKK